MHSLTIQDKESLIRAHVVWALGELLGEKAEPVVKKHLSMETDSIVLKEINRVVRNMNF